MQLHIFSLRTAFFVSRLFLKHLFLMLTLLIGTLLIGCESNERHGNIKSIGEIKTVESRLVILHPIKNLEHVWGIQPFSARDNKNGLMFHNGLDYFINNSEAVVVSSVDGTLLEARVFTRPEDGASQLNLIIETPSGPLVSYSLEPSAGLADIDKKKFQLEIANEMKSRLRVKSGASLVKGQELGVLIAQDDWAHVHMSVKRSINRPEVWLCPAEFMAPQLVSGIQSRIQRWKDINYQSLSNIEICN